MQLGLGLMLWVFLWQGGLEGGSWSSCCGRTLQYVFFSRKEAFLLAARHTPHVVTSRHQVFFPGVFLVFRVFLSGSPVPVKIWMSNVLEDFFHGFFCHGFHYTHCIVSY